MKRSVYNKLERIRKEVVMAQCEVLRWHIPGGTKENHETLSYDSWSLGQELNPGSFECGVSTTKL
jgi:hypothetical protein